MMREWYSCSPEAAMVDPGHEVRLLCALRWLTSGSHDVSGHQEGCLMNPEHSQ